MLPGCGGCRNQDSQKTEAEKEAERLAEERERKKPDFEIDPPRAEPCADPLAWPKQGRGEDRPVLLQAGPLDQRDRPDQGEQGGFRGRPGGPVGLGARARCRCGSATPRSVWPNRAKRRCPRARRSCCTSSLFVPVGQETASALIRLSARQGSLPAVRDELRAQRHAVVSVSLRRRGPIARPLRLSQVARLDQAAAGGDGQPAARVSLSGGVARRSGSAAAAARRGAVLDEHRRTSSGTTSSRARSPPSSRRPWSTGCTGAGN